MSTLPAEEEESYQGEQVGDEMGQCCGSACGVSQGGRAYICSHHFFNPLFIITSHLFVNFSGYVET